MGSEIKLVGKTVAEVATNGTSTVSPANAAPSRWAEWLRFLPVIIVALVALVVIGLVALLGPGQATEGTAEQPPRRLPVQVEPVQQVTSIEQVRSYTGDIRARQQSDLGFELSGRIEDIMVDEGDYVDTGKPLAKLDTRTLNARRDATMASLKQAQAKLLELEIGPRKETIAAAGARVREANSSLQLAELNFERRRKLRVSDAISTEEFQRARFDLQTARAIVDSAQKQLDELNAGTRDEQVAAQQAVVAQFTAALQEIDVQIEKSTILAPFSGRIVKRMADPGGLGLPSQPVLKLVETEHLEAVVGLPAETADKLQVGDSIFVSVENRDYPGKIKARIQQIETATRTQVVLIALNPSDNSRALPGQLCQIELSSTLDVSGYWVPATALTNGIRGLWSLMTVDDDGRARRQDVEVIYTDADRVLVRGTLSGNAMVITDGLHRIVDGQPVEAIENDGGSIGYGK